MKFKITLPQKKYATVLITSYILVISLVLFGLFSVMEYAKQLGRVQTDTNNPDGSLGVFSQIGQTSSLTKGKESIKAIWIATVSNINFPSERGLDQSKLKEELDLIVSSCKKLGANTIFFQVRPCSDALYDSSIFPASHYLSGTRGEKCGFDPLKYIITAAKKEGISVHAWINPVRVLPGSPTDPASREELCEGEPAALHPDWTVIYGDGRMYYDLGIPQVRSLIADGVYEIVANYDVDGIIFDDYFYPYPVYDSNGKLADFDDSATYKKYGGGRNVADFRRENVNALVRVCNSAAKKADNDCLFGVSPFGVWRNSQADGGAGTKGLESYSEIYCDTLSFVREGTVDYVAPQLYWGIGDKDADFSLLLDWWNNSLKGTDTALVPCLAPYRYSDGAYKQGEITEQIRLSKKGSSYAGCALFGYAALTDPALPVGEEITYIWYANE